MGSAQGGQRGQAEREWSARAVTGMIKAKAEQLRVSPPNVVFGLVAASALVAVAFNPATGGFLGAATSIGSNVVSDLLMRALDRWRRGHEGAPESAALAEAVAGEILAVLRRGDARAGEVRRQLVAEVDALGGFDAALRAADSAGDPELGGHLASCFGELRAGQREILGAVRDLGETQRRMRTEQRRMRIAVEEVRDRARQDQAERHGHAGGAARATPYAVPVVVPAPDGAVNTGDGGWRGGSQVWIGDRRYLLHGDLLAEETDPGHLVLRREAMARQLVPAPADGGYAWLRQAGPAHGSAAVGGGNAAVKAAREALVRECELLGQVAGIGAVPRVVQLAAGDGRTTLAVGWPVMKPGEPCRTLRASFTPGAAWDPWHLHLLLTGLGGLAVTLSELHARGVSHRSLAPDGILVTGTGRLALRDLGLAGHPPRPGEGPAGCRAPEQQPGGGSQRTGPATDVYQLAAITYHLVTGRLPAPRYPAPARSLNQELPAAVSDLLAAALDASPAARPRMSQFKPATR